MMAFHVYVDGPIERTPAGMQRLTEAMCQRYGLRPSDLISRLAKGRFRVKANVDQRTADAYARDLEKIGARVVVEEVRDTTPIPTTRSDTVSLPPPTTRQSATTPPAARVVVAKPPGRPYSFVTPPSGTPRSATTPPAGQPVRSTTPPAGRPVSSPLPPSGRPTPTSPLPAAHDARPAPSSSRPPSTGHPSAPQFSSGLAAAFSDEIPIGSFGALDADTLSLASVDGHDPGAPIPAMPSSFGPPEATPLPSAFGPPEATPSAFEPPPAKREPATRSDLPGGRSGGAGADARAKDAPLDLFAPPDSDDQSFIVELAADELEHQARKRASAPIAVVAAPAAATTPSAPVLPRKSQPSLGPAVPVTAVPAREMPQWRFAAGVAIAIVLGFVPAHLVAASREAAAFKAIDANVEQVQAVADTPETYAALDTFRAAQLDKKQGERRSIALTSMVIWGGVAGGLAYAWFRRIPWDRIARGRAG